MYTGVHSDVAQELVIPLNFLKYFLRMGRNQGYMNYVSLWIPLIWVRKGGILIDMKDQFFDAIIEGMITHKLCSPSQGTTVVQ